MWQNGSGKSMVFEWENKEESFYDYYTFSIILERLFGVFTAR